MPRPEEPSGSSMCQDDSEMVENHDLRNKDEVLILAGSRAMNCARFRRVIVSVILEPSRSSLCCGMASIHESEEYRCENEEPEVVLTKTWVVLVKGSNKTWVPEILEKFGLAFIRLQKFDRNLTQFILGKSMDMRAGKNVSCNTKSFDHLLELRREASIAAVEAALQREDDSKVGIKKKKRAVKEQDKDVLDVPWVMMEVPSIVLPDGKTVGPQTCKVLFGLRDADLWIEFCAMNLLYFKMMIRADHQQGLSGRTKVKRRRFSPKKSPNKARRGLQEKQECAPSTPDNQFAVASPKTGQD